MLYIIGLGLGDYNDITINGLNAIKKSDYVYLEHYTSVLIDTEIEELEKFYEKKIILADRELMESGCDDTILKYSKDKIVSVLVVGDPFGATTHSDLFLRAKDLKIDVKIIHNASIMNAVGSTGLQLYQFGQTISIPLFLKNWKPASFYDKIKINIQNGFHTLCLLDIKVKEPNIEALEQGKIRYDPPYFMTINEALEQLLYVEEEVKKEKFLIRNKTLCVGVARVGAKDQTIISGTMEELLKVNFGKPLHSLIIVGEAHDLELEMIEHFSIKNNDVKYLE